VAVLYTGMGICIDWKEKNQQAVVQRRNKIHKMLKQQQNDKPKKKKKKTKRSRSTKQHTQPVCRKKRKKNVLYKLDDSTATFDDQFVFD
jgi:hypothetical protein